MQLIESKMHKNQAPNIASALGLAACALLGTSATAQAEINKDWQFDTAVLYYGETDRVMATEAMINGKKEFADDHFLNLRLTLDTLTGASANGAVAQPDVQTFTRPSGNGQYDVKPGETPLDDTFRDTRVQLNAQWTQPLARDYTFSSGVHISKEYDYLSLGVNGSLAIDFNKKNTTLSLGGSYFNDTFNPEGGIPIAFTSMPVGDSKAATWDDTFNSTRLTDQDDKTTTDLLIGVTQIINRRMLVQLNYSHSIVDGYQSDPFKVLSVVNSEGLAQDYLYENRPDKRTKQSVYLQSKVHLDSSIVDVSYRYMWDDWEINSHTVDTRWRLLLWDDSYLEPHFRYYQQSAAEFYQPFLNAAEALPQYASADYRIGEMDAYTLGLEYGTKLSNGHALSLRAEYYTQQPTNNGFAEPGALSSLDLFPSVDAVVLQFSYSF